MKIVALALSLAVVAAPHSTSAQGTPQPRTVVFEDAEDVSAAPTGPVDYTLVVPPRSTRASLIRVRETFLPELSRSATAL